MAVGAGYSLYNDTAGPGAKLKPSPEIIAYDALGLAGVGLAILGTFGGLLRDSRSTMAIGVVGGVAAFVTGTSLAVTKAASGA